MNNSIFYAANDLPEPAGPWINMESLESFHMNSLISPSPNISSENSGVSGFSLSFIFSIVLNYT